MDRGKHGRAICPDCRKEMHPSTGGCIWTHYKMATGEMLPRLAYGERGEYTSPEGCHDCGCAPGTHHHFGCDSEYMADNGEQAIGCERIERLARNYAILN